jgi:ribosomal protein L11 methyltransferase
LRLGAGRALGVDTDPIAIESTVVNAERNGLADRLEARLGSLPTGEPPFDLVLANLIASLLIRLAGELAAELSPSGALIASGIFVDREGDVRDALASAGLSVTTRLAEGDWVALHAARTGANSAAG